MDPGIVTGIGNALIMVKAKTPVQSWVNRWF